MDYNIVPEQNWQKPRTPKILSVVLVLLILVGTFYSGMRYANYRNTNAVLPPATEITNRDGGQPITVDFSLFWNVLAKLEDHYVDQSKLIDKRKLVYGAIKGMVSAVGDPYTVYMEPEESKKFSEQINGSFSGVGIEIGLRNQLITVISPIKGSPAEKAGIIAGDIITKVNDKDATNFTVEQAVSLIRGKRGTTVKLTLQHPGAKAEKDYTLTRDDIKIPSIEWKLIDDHIAYIQLYIFNKNIDDDFTSVAKAVLASKADRIILDLRNNPGGLLDSAVNIASWFLDPNQTVVSERFSDSQETALKSTNNAKLKRYPIVVIINKGSASASEILAGALRDNRGVKIIGETSYGKGSVQEVVDLGSAQNGTLKVTIAKWFTPSGISISDNGIKPDIEVKLTDTDIEKSLDPQLDKAKELSKWEIPPLFYQ